MINNNVAHIFIEWAKKELNLSTYKLSVLMQIAPNTIYKFKNNNAKFLKIEHIVNLAKNLPEDQQDFMTKFLKNYDQIAEEILKDNEYIFWNR